MARIATCTAKVTDSAIASFIRKGQGFSLSYKSEGMGVCTATYWVNLEESSRIRYWDGKVVAENGEQMDVNCITTANLCKMVNGMLADRAGS